MFIKEDFYRVRINNVINHMNKNLSEPLSISQLASIANFSLFHFQRIYKSLLNESPHQTLLRLRLEKAVFLIKHKRKMSLLEIALECGFSSAENFSRQFKARYKIRPSTLKKDLDLQKSRIYQEDNQFDFYIQYQEARKQIEKSFIVKIEYVPNIPIVLIKSIFGNDGSSLIRNYEKLITWANEKGVNYEGELKRFGMSIDDPEVTPANKYRYDFALSFPSAEKVDGIFELANIPEGQYATVHCKGDINTVAKAWDFLYKKWLPESGYSPKHYPAIEEFLEGPETIGWDKFNIKCRIPITKE